MEEYLSHNDQSHPPCGRGQSEISCLENSKPICYNKTTDSWLMGIGVCLLFRYDRSIWKLEEA